MLGLISDERQDSKCLKHHIDPKNIVTINKHLADQRESHMAEDEKLETAEYIKVDVPPDKEAEVLNILRKHEKIWSGQLGKIKATELQTDLKHDAEPLKSPLYLTSLSRSAF